MEFDWQRFIFDPDSRWMDRLLARARRRFSPDDTFAEEAHTYAIGELSNDDWQRLQGFRGRSQPGTYLFAIYDRLLTDYHRKRFSRVRPPKWLKERGPTWVRVWELLCLQRNLPETVVDWLCAHDQVERATVRTMMRAIKARIPECGQVESHAAGGDAAGGGLESSPEAELDRADLAALLLELASLLQEVEPAGSSDPARSRAETLAGDLVDAAEPIVQALAISDQERRLLKLRYHVGRPVAGIARDLHAQEHQIRRQLKTIEARIADVLAARGITRDVLRRLLDG